MNARDILTAVLLGALGIAAAVAIAVFANRITGEEIGLASEPVSVIPADSAVRPKPAPGPKEDRGDDRGSEGAEAFDDDGGASGASGSGGGDDGGSEGKDDGGGGSGTSGSNSGSGSSGGDSSGSGSGSDDSGSSGSGSSGSGSGGDDPPEVEDD